MSNPGNLGQRFRMSKLTGVEVKGGKVVFHLECGHDYSSTPLWGTPEESAERAQARIGKRERCDKCMERS